MTVQTTETRNEKSKHLDEMSSFEIVSLMNEEDKKVAFAVEKCLPEIAKTVDWAVEAFKNGGRLLYFGAGTSGRLGVLDASECWPTFGIDHGVVVGTIAGGDKALRYSVENSEDSKEDGINDFMSLNPTKNDVVMGLTASGSTPYVLAVLEQAQKMGIKTVGYSSNENAKLKQFSDVFINPIVGSEVLTGSSRLKSGTAEKMVLNQITTAAFVRFGKVYENLMVEVRVMNEKLKDRAIRIISDIANVEYKEASDALIQAQKYLNEPTKGVPLAVIIASKKCSAEQANAILKRNDNFVRRALMDQDI